MDREDIIMYNSENISGRHEENGVNASYQRVKLASGLLQIGSPSSERKALIHAPNCARTT